MSLEDRIEALVTPTIETLGYELVRVVFLGKQRLTLQIMAERIDGVGMTVDDCATISRAVSAVLDVEDPFDGAYSLEVSSPGLDRPLTRVKDFVQFVGFEAKLETCQPAIDGKRKFRGTVLGIDDNCRIKMMVNDQEVVFPLADVKSAKLVLTDQLIAAGTKKQIQ